MRARISQGIARGLIGGAAALLVGFALTTKPGVDADLPNAHQDAALESGQVNRTTARLGQKIALKGRWAIEVRNLDGTLADDRRFDNALTADGRDAFARFLVQDQAPGDWAVGIKGVASQTDQRPRRQASRQSPQVRALEELRCPTGQFHTNFLGVTDVCVVGGPAISVDAPVPPDINAGKLFLRADLGVLPPGTVTNVHSFVGRCPVSGPACPPNAVFTSANVTPPVVVSGDQAVTVAVAFSFP